MASTDPSESIRPRTSSSRCSRLARMYWWGTGLLPSTSSIRSRVMKRERNRSLADAPVSVDTRKVGSMMMLASRP